jgi:alkylation response protein AidB-like acyl-CoA dehydrogenase
VDFRDTPEEATWREEVREFIKKELPTIQDAKEAAEDFAARGFAIWQWRAKLAQKGWIAPAWPKEYGGADMSVMQQFVFNQEMAEARAPYVVDVGIGLAGPTLIVHGTEEQRKEHLPPILSNQSLWCQGFSEPEAGSDLASLRTRAVRDGDDYVINGQKIWITIAHLATWMLLLARTDPDAPKHKGISYFLLDMKSPGVEVRPLVNMAGTKEFNEVFFDNVRVPRKNLVGEENRGWYVATTTLDFERSAIGSAIGQRQTVEDFVEFAKEHRGQGSCQMDGNSSVRLELADRYLEAEIGQMLSARVISLQARGNIPNYEASITKLYVSELSQRISRTGMKLIGLYGMLDRGDKKWTPLAGRMKFMYVRNAARTIEAGTSEIQRGIIATRGLGLPRD